MSDKLRIYVVYDKKGKRYDTPFFAFDDLRAKRNFIFGIERENNVFGRFKDDFQLLRIGEFGILSGELVIVKQEIVMEGNQVERRQET